MRAQDAQAVAARADHNEAMQRTLTGILNSASNSGGGGGGSSAAAGTALGWAQSLQDVDEGSRRGAPQRKRTRA